MTFEEMSVMAVTKSFYIKIAFVTAIGDIFAHVTAITDPWIFISQSLVTFQERSVMAVTKSF